MLNAKSAERTARKWFIEASTVLKDFSVIAGASGTLAMAVSVTGPATVAAILGACGAGISAATRLLTSEDANPKSTCSAKVPSYDKFGLLLFVACQRAYLEAITDSPLLKKLNSPSESRILSDDDVKQLRSRLTKQIAELDAAEVRYHYSVGPLDGNTPLFKAFSHWLMQALTPFAPRHLCQEEVANLEQQAHRRLNLALTSSKEPFSWMRRYLALDVQATTMEEVRNLRSEQKEALRSIRETLEGWTTTSKIEDERRTRRWAEYLETLATLPDQTESMYMEDFGVREVFVPPRANYHRAGLPTPDVVNEIPDIGLLLAALVSQRVRGDDIVFICGGPGSGKSTLCRIFASELAKTPNVHPVFLKLRKVKEGDAVESFIQDELSKAGLINSLGDLNDIPNIVLILDGFDELVMASRNRLRRLFSALTDSLTTGPLRKAKVIVSGRDTLFPNGSSLPRGSHVVNVLPFDSQRVHTWGHKWRQKHSTGPGHSFQPEVLLKGKNQKAFSELATWPLTLHLIARLHTSGLFDANSVDSDTVEKAYLYRGILHETALRQEEQASGAGRLSANDMREFLRAIAWMMYSQGSDAMEIHALLPIAKEFFGRQDESALSELAEIAVVNSPELQKGEETGFEFVHKSFAEFLVAEEIAKDVEASIHEMTDYDKKRKWSRTLQQAADLLWSRFHGRLLTAEVQEMLEPMLGVFVSFSEGKMVSQRVPEQHKSLGLQRLLKRTQDLYTAFSQDALDGSTASGWGSRSGSRASVANFGVGIVLLGAAASRRLRHDDNNTMVFELEPVPDCFWPWIHTLNAGGISLQGELAIRVFRGTSVAGLNERTNIGEGSNSLRLGELWKVYGFNSNLRREVELLETELSDLIDRCAVALLLSAKCAEDGSSHAHRSRRSTRLRREMGDEGHFVGHIGERGSYAFGRFKSILNELGLSDFDTSSESPSRQIPSYERLYWHLTELDYDQDRLRLDVLESMCDRGGPPWGSLPPLSERPEVLLIPRKGVSKERTRRRRTRSRKTFDDVIITDPSE